MVGTDASEVGPRAAAEVEGRHREAAALQTHHVGTTGGAILHIAQVRAVLQEGVASPETHQGGTWQKKTEGRPSNRCHFQSSGASPAVQVLVLVVEGEAGHLPLQVPKLWFSRHVGAEEEAAQDVPAQRRGNKHTKQRENIRE